MRVDPINYEKHNFTAKTKSFISADQFEYVMNNYLVTNYLNLKDEEREQFFTEWIDTIYLLCIDTYKNGDKESFIQTGWGHMGQFIMYLSKDTQQLVETAEGMIEVYRDSKGKVLPEGGLTPSEYVKKNGKEAEESMRQAEEKRQKEIDMLDRVDKAREQHHAGSED